VQHLILDLRHQTEPRGLVEGPRQFLYQGIGPIIVDGPAPAGRRSLLGNVFAGFVTAPGHQGHRTIGPVRAVEAGVKLGGIVLDDLEVNADILPVAGNRFKRFGLPWPAGKNTEVDGGGEAIRVAGLLQQRLGAFRIVG
jgi:hypothetical protein